MKRAIICLFLLIFLLPTIADCAEIVTIAVEEPTLNDYNRLVARYGNDPQRIERIIGDGAGRPVVDLVIIAKALYLGGVDARLEFDIVPNVRRQTEHVATGQAVICGQQLNKGTMHVSGYSDALYMSDPITRFGEFQKGFYCLDINKKVLGLSSAKELEESSVGMIGLHWNNDAQVLEDMGITNVIRSPTFPSMIKMIIAGRADWIPLELSKSADMSFTLDGARFVPVPGIKFSLLESRHFFVSKAHPQGERVFNALQKGLAELRKQGFIRKALEQAGFFNARTDSWTVLNAEAMKTQ